MTPELANRMRWERELDSRNSKWTLEDLDEILPSEGYTILEPPPGYSIMPTPSRKVAAESAAASGASAGFYLQSEEEMAATSQAKMATYDIQNIDGGGVDDLPMFKVWCCMYVM